MLSSTGPKLRGGGFHLLGHILALDVGVVTMSGCSVVPIRQGLPEGGSLGPVLYPLVPNSLAISLKEAGCGVAVVWPGLELALPTLMRFRISGAASGTLATFLMGML